MVGAIGAAWAVKKTPSLERRTLLRGATAILALLICLSTLFIKQHAVLDVIGGLGLALAVGLPLYHHGIIRRSRPAMEQE